MKIGSVQTTCSLMFFTSLLVRGFGFCQKRFLFGKLIAVFSGFVRSKNARKNGTINCSKCPIAKRGSETQEHILCRMVWLKWVKKYSDLFGMVNVKLSH